MSLLELIGLIITIISLIFGVLSAISESFEWEVRFGILAIMGLCIAIYTKGEN